MGPWQSVLSSPAGEGSYYLTAFLSHRKKSDLKEDFKKTYAITICRSDEAVREREVPQAEVAQGAMLGILSLRGWFSTSSSI